MSEAGSKTDKKRGRSLAGSEETGVSDTEEGKERKLKLVKTSAGLAGADESESTRGEEAREEEGTRTHTHLVLPAHVLDNVLVDDRPIARHPYRSRPAEPSVRLP